MPDYLEFELEINAARGRTYPVTVRSPGGDAAAEFMLPFNELALENALLNLKMALLQSGGKRRRTLTPEQQTAQNFGRALFEALFAGDVRTRYEVSRQMAAQQGTCLRIQLRINDPDLIALPWEFLYDPSEQDYLCLLSGAPLVRYISQPRPLKPLPVQPPLRILCMASAPVDLEPLDVDIERQRMDEALAELIKQGLVQIHWLPGIQSWRNLQRAIQADRPWHVFHFVGHGGFDVRQDEGLLAFEHEVTREAELISATNLARLLNGAQTLRLALLNACDSARTGQEMLSSTAAMLAQRGVPAVIAMQYPITDRAAIEFSRSFYDLLMGDGRVDAAITEARKAVAIALHPSLEWGTPVLYLHTPDVRLFELKSAAAQTPGSGVTTGAVSGISGGILNLGSGTVNVIPSPPGDLDATLLALNEMMAAGEWDMAHETLSQLEVDFPDHVRLKLPHKKITQALESQREAEEKAKREADERAMLEAKAKAEHEAEERARLEAEAKAKREAEERSKREAAAKAQREAEERARREAEEKAKREAEERARLEAEAKAQREAEEHARREAEAKAKREAEELARREAEAKAKREAEEHARREAEEKVRKDALLRRDGDRTFIRLDAAQEIAFIRIPAGEFLMGSDPKKDGWAYPQEQPQHRVSLPEYWMGQTPVTNAQYATYIMAVKADAPAHWKNNQPPQDKLDHPVVRISWKDAVAYCEWLSQLTGRQVGLPTEAEWEKAARGTDGRIYPWGKQAPNARRCNFERTVYFRNSELIINTTPVGRYSPAGDSPYGCVDMAGNVYEWCADYYSESYYAKSPATSPTGPAISEFRAVRGGCWESSSIFVRVAFRGGSLENPRHKDQGFRCRLSAAP